MSIGIRLILSRDFSAKYAHRDRSFAQQPPFRSDWSMLGHYDYLKAIRIDSLDEITDAPPRETPQEQAMYEGPSLDLILIPSHVLSNTAPFSPTDKDFFIRLEHPHESSTDPYLIIMPFILSPPALEARPNFTTTTEVLKSTSDMIRSVAEQHGLRSFEVFTSLSTFDAVLVGFPQSVEEINEYNATLLDLRKSELDVLFSSDSLRQLKQYFPLPGHAFAFAESHLAININDNAALDKYFEDDGAISLKAIDAELAFRVRCEPGHEGAVISRLVQMGVLSSGSKRQTLYSWDECQLSFSLSSFDRLRLIIRSFADPWFREGNILETSTVLSFATDFEHKRDAPRAWQFSDAVRSQLSQMETLIVKSGSNLGQRHMQELEGSFQILRRCFSRAETTAVAKELMPSLLNFLLLISDEGTRRYLESNKNTETFHQEVTQFLYHMRRALVNRIEQRVFLADPPFPSVLTTGAARLVSSYTAAFYLAWQLVTRDPNSRFGRREDTDECRASGYAGCVAVWNHGKIACEEAMEDLRQYLFPDRRGLLAHPVIALLRMSGAVTLRIEEAFVHAIHEAAKFSEWGKSQATLHLRQILNAHLCRYGAIAVMQLIAKDETQIPKSMLAREPIVFPERILKHAAFHAISTELDISEPLRNCKTVSELTDMCTPLELAALIISGMRIVIPTELVERVLADEYRLADLSTLPLFCELYAKYLRIGGPSIERQLEARSQLLHEIVPDIAVVDRLFNIVELDRTTAVPERSDQIHEYYISVLRVTGESIGDNARAGFNVLARWAAVFGALATNSDGWRTTSQQWNSDRNDEFREYVFREMRLTLEDSRRRGLLRDSYLASLDDVKHVYMLVDKNGLSGSLSNLSVFGGSLSMPSLPVPHGLLPSERNLILMFQKTWLSRGTPTHASERLKFAFALWAKAQRIGIDRALVRAGNFSSRGI